MEVEEPLAGSISIPGKGASARAPWSVAHEQPLVRPVPRRSDDAEKRTGTAAAANGLEIVLRQTRTRIDQCRRKLACGSLNDDPKHLSLDRARRFMDNPGAGTLSRFCPARWCGPWLGPCRLAAG
jgi:hypothetical protein